MQGVVLFDRLQDGVVVHHLTVGAGALPGLEGERSQFLLLLQGLCGDRGGRGDRELELFIARVVLSEIVQRHHHVGAAGLLELAHHELAGSSGGDRKSTRLNSSHVATSYAVFCLKKKKTNTIYSI